MAGQRSVVGLGGMCSLICDWVVQSTKQDGKACLLPAAMHSLACGGLVR